MEITTHAAPGRGPHGSRRGGRLSLASRAAKPSEDDDAPTSALGSHTSPPARRTRIHNPPRGTAMRPITRTITIALTALVIAAPVASAHVANEHAGIAKTAAPGQYTPGSPTPVSSPPGAADVQPPPPAGQPTWPTNPQPLVP